jgi:biofilm PGA synthesis N-glycosyltransferase PgaC
LISLLITICFWLCVACVGYTYVGYPLLIALLARRHIPIDMSGTAPHSASIILAAHNEPRLRRRVGELTQLIDSANIIGELIVVLDGPADVELSDLPGVRVIHLRERRGKATAITMGAAAAFNDILIFADSRQVWESSTIPRLLRNFAEPTVGAVSGELMIADSSGVAGGVGAYWKYEKWIRRQESRFSSTVGVTGAVSAVRRSLFAPLPRGLILDDVYWPMRVAMSGYRVVFDDAARAHDRLPDKPRDEFRRKVRTLSGNFQLLAHLPTALLPWENPLWWQLISHKVLRLFVPWAFLAAFFSAWALRSSPFYFALCWVQVAGYATAVLGMTKLGGRFKLPAAGAALLMLNAAAFVGFWAWALGRTDGTWRQATYIAATAT